MLLENVRKLKGHKLQAYVNTYLLSRLCNEYKKAMNFVKTPKEILEKLEQIRYPKVPSAKYEIRRQWAALIYNSTETASSFIERFENILTKLQKIEAVKEEDITGNFVTATKQAARSVANRYNASNGTLTFDKLKLLLLDEEAAESEMKKRAGEGGNTATGAIDSELKSLEKNKTWAVVNRSEVPRDQKIMNAKWIFKRKEEPTGGIRYKARLVIRGFMDSNKYDLTETYAPVARLTDIRFLLAVANKLKLDVHQLDVKTAFLNGDLERTVYMEIPEGYDHQQREKLVCKLQNHRFSLVRS